MPLIKKTVTTIFFGLVFGFVFTFVFGSMNFKNVDVLNIFHTKVVKAECDSWCQAFTKASNIWKGFVGNMPVGSDAGGGGGGTSNPEFVPFGGRVIATIPCVCSASYAFIIQPVSGPAGVYNVSWAVPGALRKYFMPFPGNWVLGSAHQNDICSIYVIVYCFNFETTYGVNVTTGVGTSLSPVGAGI